MTDKELLELAAKAVGIKGEFKREHQTYGDQWIEGIDTGNRFWWNPLTDDGDALLLAVKLELCITQWPSHSQYPPHVMVGYKTGPQSGKNWIQEYEGDAMAANRRAIICAAAEIGKAMP